ncbi:MAG: protein kinase [Coleofasciculaceae cyanobacterium RL_1_1]|nr:protein kinase [Coleofasciculaceae cyanobacterium RL_1_1]
MHIDLKPIAGKHNGAIYRFPDRTTALIGRSDACHIQLPDDDDHRSISRFHCLLDLNPNVNPPQACIRDFGSRNGTYVNGRKIGQRPVDLSASQGRKQAYPECMLNHGDLIQLGKTVFAIEFANEAKTDLVAPAFQDSSPQAPPPNLRQWLQQLLNQVNGGELNLKAIRGYDVVRSIGKGGFGEVFLAKHRKTGEFVALKLMLPQVAAGQANVDRFLREVKVNQALRHPHIARLLEFGSYKSSWVTTVFFFTLEYCSAGNLADFVVAQGGSLPVELAIDLTLQILDGLHYAHRTEFEQHNALGRKVKVTGVVHRDIKPHNILLMQDRGKLKAKVADFGLAKAFDLAGLSGLTIAGEMAGTPLFMPRQQMLDFQYARPEVDVWAAAATLYFMLTGEPPRDFRGKADPLMVILQSAPIPIRDRQPRIPSQLATVIDRAVQDTPTIGFSSAEALKLALLQAIN